MLNLLVGCPLSEDPTLPAWAACAALTDCTNLTLLHLSVTDGNNDCGCASRCCQTSPHHGLVCIAPADGSMLATLGDFCPALREVDVHMYISGSVEKSHIESLVTGCAKLQTLNVAIEALPKSYTLTAVAAHTGSGAAGGAAASATVAGAKDPPLRSQPSIGMTVAAVCYLSSQQDRVRSSLILGSQAAPRPVLLLDSSAELWTIAGALGLSLDTHLEVYAADQLLQVASLQELDAFNEQLEDYALTVRVEREGASAADVAVVDSNDQQWILLRSHYWENSV